jgi:thymidylate synthase ThyX
MTIEAKVIADSFWTNQTTGKKHRITTFQLKYPRLIHGEFMTHRVFSRNASSSRAIPVMKLLKDIWNDPAMPVHWGENQSGMQAKAELSGWKRKAAQALWIGASKVACAFAYGMVKVGLHKQVANRICEPWQHISVIVTATDWDNFYELRDHPDAQPEIRELAQAMKAAQDASVPRELAPWDWHLPYCSAEELRTLPLDVLKKISAARCARVSYLTHDGQNPDAVKDVALHDRLVGSKPIHASPVEHQARPSMDDNYHKNFCGFIQYREEVEAMNLQAR